MLNYLIFFVIFLHSLSVPANAEVFVKHNPSDMTAIVRIEKKIEIEDLQDLKYSLSSLSAEGYKLKLNSIALNTSGGNPTAAMLIGKLIREKRLNTYLAPTSHCHSACIFILISGMSRMAYGEVTVHRISYADEFPIEKLIKTIADDDATVKEYIQSMGISILLNEAISQIPFWGTRLIDTVEKRRWGINANERIYEETWFRKTAKAKGLKIIELQKIFNKNFSQCELKAKSYKATIFECIESVL